MLPGKFSLGFSLAAATFRAVTGRTPDQAAPGAAAGPPACPVAPVRHRAMVAAALARERRAAAPVPAGGIA